MRSVHRKRRMRRRVSPHNSCEKWCARGLTIGGEHGAVPHSRAGLGNSVDVNGLEQLSKRGRRSESLAANLMAVRTVMYGHGNGGWGLGLGVRPLESFASTRQASEEQAWQSS